MFIHIFYIFYNFVGGTRVVGICMCSRRKTEEILMDLEVDLWTKGYGRLRVKPKDRIKIDDESGHRILEPLGQQLHRISVEIAV